MSWGLVTTRAWLKHYKIICLLHEYGGGDALTLGNHRHRLGSRGLMANDEKRAELYVDGSYDAGQGRYNLSEEISGVVLNDDGGYAASASPCKSSQRRHGERRSLR